MSAISNSTRLTNVFSRNVENLIHAVSLHFRFHNFARVHKSLRESPAMETGVADHLWTIEDIFRLVPESVATPRVPYKLSQDVQGVVS